jgi:hypothetical protein
VRICTSNGLQIYPTDYRLFKKLCSHSRTQKCTKSDYLSVRSEKVNVCHLPLSRQTGKANSSGNISSRGELRFRGRRNITVVGGSAFFGNASLQSVCIPSSVEVIGSYGFSHCGMLSIVIFETESKLVRIDEGAFCCSRSLHSICIPASVEIIGSGCFSCCSSLANLTFEPMSKLNRIGAEEK